MIKFLRFIRSLFCAKPPKPQRFSCLIVDGKITDRRDF